MVPVIPACEAHFFRICRTTSGFGHIPNRPE
jgi:hypothetical protein